MEVFKNIWLTIGSIAIAFVIVFCVVMLTPKFREKVYDLAQVQPSSNVEEKTMEINNLQEEINSYKAQIASLTQERTTLSNQMLALNPTKINGICGRLLCCLGYENDIYTELKKDMPKVGMVADTPQGMGKVVSIDVFKKTYSIKKKKKGIVTFSKDEK